MNEAVGYGVMSGVVDAQEGAQCFGVLDAATFANPPHDPRFAGLIKSGVMQTQWKRDTLDRAVAEGRLVRADTIEVLGKIEPVGVRTQPPFQRS